MCLPGSPCPRSPPSPALLPPSPVLPPPHPKQVVIIHIGINNDLAEGPAFKLDFLLTYLAGVYPRTRIIVVTPLPSKKRAYIAYRDAYARVVARHKGVFFSLCGAALDPSSTLNFKDGVHPVAGGYNIIFK